MRSTTIRLALVALAVVCFRTSMSAGAQAPAAQAPAPAPPDFSKVEIKTTKITNNFYTLEGQGGTIGVQAGPDGIFMVDSQFGPLTEKLVAAIRQISDRPIRFLVNTHVHGDHTGGNGNFAKLGVAILARPELRARLAQGTPPPPAAALPMVTYRGPVSVYMNGEEIQLIPVPVAHTDGDTMVRFPVADVLMTGDFFRSLGYPNIDRNNGGSLKGMLEGLNAAINAIGPTTKVIPGHGVITDRAGLTAHRDMIMAVRDRVAQLVQQGKTVEEVTAAKPTSSFDAQIPNGTMTSDRFVGQLYAELKGSR